LLIWKPSDGYLRWRTLWIFVCRPQLRWRFDEIRCCGAFWTVQCSRVIFCASWRWFITRNSFLSAIKGWCMVRVRQTVCDMQGVVTRQFIHGVVATEAQQSQTGYSRRDQSGMLRLNIYMYLFKQLMLYNFIHLIFALFNNYTYCF